MLNIYSVHKIFFENFLKMLFVIKHKKHLLNSQNRTIKHSLCSYLALIERKMSLQHFGQCFDFTVVFVRGQFIVLKRSEIAVKQEGALWRYYYGALLLSSVESVYIIIYKMTCSKSQFRMKQVKAQKVHKVFSGNSLFMDFLPNER